MINKTLHLQFISIHFELCFSFIKFIMCPSEHILKYVLSM